MKRDINSMEQRHIAALNRRLNYLEDRKDNYGSYNSFDLAEIYALRWAIAKLTKCDGTWQSWKQARTIKEPIEKPKEA